MQQQAEYRGMPNHNIARSCAQGNVIEELRRENTRLLDEVKALKSIWNHHIMRLSDAVTLLEQVVNDQECTGMHLAEIEAWLKGYASY
jgi:hypothetical protein